MFSFTNFLTMPATAISAAVAALFTRNYATDTSLGADATYARASSATVVDHEDVVRTAISGEARFEGARRVQNYAPYSEDFTQLNGGISAGNSATATTVTFTNAVGYRYKYTTSTGTKTGEKYIARVTLSSSDKTTVGFSLFTVGSDESTFISVTLTATPTVYTVPLTATNAYTAVAIGLDNRASVGGDQTTSGTITVTDFQIERSTGRASPTIPSEYVSVGVGTEEVSIREQDLTTSAIWIEGSGWSVSGGFITLTSAGHFSRCDHGTSPDPDFIVGRKYEITFTISDYVSGVIQV